MQRTATMNGSDAPAWLLWLVLALFALFMLASAALADRIPEKTMLVKFSEPVVCPWNILRATFSNYTIDRSVGFYMAPSKQVYYRLLPGEWFQSATAELEFATAAAHDRSGNPWPATGTIRYGSGYPDPLPGAAVKWEIDGVTWDMY